MAADFPTSTSPGGVAGNHPARELPAHVAPTAGKKHNDFRAPLTPLACWKIDGPRLDAERSFIKPEARLEFARLRALIEHHTIHANGVAFSPILSIFGHAGSPESPLPVKRPQYRLTIRRTDSVWPVKLAEICTHDANRYRQLEPSNPHLLKAPGQWRDLWAGDVIYFPETWTEDEIDRARAKYLVEPQRAAARPETRTDVDVDRAKRLSGRRARAVYAILTRSPEDWEALYLGADSRDPWGEPVLSAMWTAVHGPDPDPMPTAGSASETRVDSKGELHLMEPPVPASSQSSPRWAVSYYAENPASRKELFLEYMDWLCGKEFRVKRENFLGRGEDPEGKGDYQGCACFNPLFVTSQEAAENPEAWSAFNGANRRVLIYLFERGNRTDVSKWPCPRVTEDTRACQRRFWKSEIDSPGHHRRQLKNVNRVYPHAQDTMACRFYQRIAHGSPCERWYDKVSRPSIHLDTVELRPHGVPSIWRRTVIFERISRPSIHERSIEFLRTPANKPLPRPSIKVETITMDSRVR